MEATAIPTKVTKNSAEQYHWGTKGTGWLFHGSKEITIVEEKIAPGIKEIRHYHEQASQYFYIISGTGTFEINEESIMIGKGEFIEVSPGMVHQLKNESTEDLDFLIISTPNTFNDRIEQH